MASPLINQFAQTPLQGMLDLTAIGGEVFSARVSANIGAGVVLVAGQAVKGDTAAPGTSYDGVPPVLPLASSADPLLGFVKYDIKSVNFPVNARVEIAVAGTFMYMPSDATNSGAISRFGAVEWNNTNLTVQAWAGVNPICGYAWDAAINTGDLIRIRIASPQISASNTSQSVKTVSVTATLAQINAGLVVIPGITGKKITVTNFVERVTGAFTTGTSVNLQSDTTSVIVESTAEAGLTNGAILFPTSSNVTLGAGFAAPLPAAEGLKIVNIGTAQAGGTSITFTISYIQA